MQGTGSLMQAIQNTLIIALIAASSGAGASAVFTASASAEGVSSIIDLRESPPARVALRRSRGCAAGSAAGAGAGTTGAGAGAGAAGAALG